MTVLEDLRRQTGYVESDGERIYFESTGAGRPIVLCHGLGGNHAIWWRQIERLAAAHQLVTWDQRGFGNSTHTGGMIGTAVARRDLAMLVDHLDLPQFDLIGQSMGGWVALGYALEHPERLHSVVLSTTLAGAESAYVDRLVNAEPSRDRLNRREHPVLSAEFCRQYPDLAVLYNQISSFGAKPDPQAILRTMAADRFGQDQLRALDVPTLVLTARGDQVCPPTAMVPVVEAIAQAEIVEIDGEHSVYYEDPDAWNDAVLDFIDRVDQRHERPHRP